MYNVFGQGGPHLYGERIVQTANTVSFIKRSLPHSPIYVHDCILVFAIHTMYMYINVTPHQVWSHGISTSSMVY